MLPIFWFVWGGMSDTKNLTYVSVGTICVQHYIIISSVYNYKVTYYYIEKINIFVFVLQINYSSVPVYFQFK